jgi:hypothetical protein
MNRDKIIAQMLDEWCLSENSVEDLEPGGTKCDAEYVRDVFLPEMQKRLPEGEIITCDDLRLEVQCCDICHGYYPHYDMYVVDLPDGRTGWICCAVHQVLFPKTALPDNDSELVDIERILGGDGSDGQGA